MDVIRITTTPDKASALADAGRRLAIQRDRDATPDATLEAAVAEVEEALGQSERNRRMNKTLWDMGFPNPQVPERNEDGSADFTETHPSYALIGVNRHTAGPRGTALAGTDFLHQQYVVITLKRAMKYRSLSGDRWHGREQIVEIALSEAQWATFVSSFGIGDGVPATLQWTETDGHVPGIVSITDRRTQVSGEVKRSLAEAVAAIDDILADTKITKATREKAQRAKMRLTDSVPFVVKRADEHMEDTIEHAKVEVSAYANAAIRSAGLAALAGQPAPIALITSGENES